MPVALFAEFERHSSAQMQSPPSSRSVPVRALSVLVIALLTACNAQSPTGLLASGKELVAKGDHKAAVIQFKSALQSDPASREARLLLGRSQLEVGEIDGAIAELTRALNDGAENADVLPSLSRALVLAGEYRKLVSTYGDLKLADKAAQSALRTNVASAWGALGDRAKTEAAVADALSADPAYGPAKVLKARILAGGKQFEQASVIVDEVLARDPKYYEAWLLRGELRDFASNDLKGAGEAYRKAVELAPAYVPAQAALIGLLVRQRDVPGAKAQADRLRAARPNHPYTVLIDAHLAFLDHKPERARELVQLLLRAFPDHQGILILAGAVEAQLGATIQAAAFFGKVLQLNPAMDIARRNLAEAEIRLGQPAKALETLKPMLSAEAPKADALALAGEAELRQGNAAAAEKYYLRAAKADPDNLRVQTAAAMTRLWYGDGSEALAELQGLAAKSPDTYADEALLAARMKRREFDAALGVIDAMAKKQPGKAFHAELRGRVHLAKRDLPAARQAFEQAVQMDPGLFAAVASLAQIDELDKQPQNAVARLEANIKANPKNAMAMLAVADIKERQGAAVADVRKVLADAVAAAPASSEPRLKQIDYLLRKRQFKDALAAAQDAVAALPADAQILDAVGQAQLQAGGAEQALTAFRRLAAAVPNSPTPYMRLAEVYMLLGKRDQAEVAINKALEIEPTLAAAQTSLIDLLVTSNRQKAAAEYIDRVKKARPTAAAGYLLEATYHVRLRNADAAAGALREGLTKTNDPEIAAKLLGLLIQSGKTAEAEKFGASWLRQHPGDLAFEYQMSSSDIARGDFKSAEQRLRRVLAAAPNNVAALNNMAWVLIKTGGSGAVQFAQRAVDLVPDRPPLMDTLAQALAADKQVPAALDMQKRAVGLAPDDNGLRLNLARLALQAGDKALAKQELERLQKLGATFPAQQEVEKLLRGL